MCKKNINIRFMKIIFRNVFQRVILKCKKSDKNEISNKLEQSLLNKSSANPNEKITDIKTAISFKNLSYSYQYEKPTLNNIYLTFEKFKKYIIIDLNTYGINVLTQVLMKYYQSYSGNIEVYNIDLNNMSIETLYNNISLIQNEIFIFNGSIKENITLFTKYNDDEINHCLYKSGLSTLVNSLENNIDTQINPSENDLSIEVMQKIALARALIKGINIIILDKAALACDYETDFDIEKLILDIQSITLITMTNKLVEKSLSSYDEIIVIKEGTVIEHGNLQTLISKRGYFYNLYFR